MVAESRALGWLAVLKHTPALPQSHLSITANRNCLAVGHHCCYLVQSWGFTGSCRSVHRGLVSASKIRWTTCKICIKPTNTAHRLNSTLIITDFCLKNFSNEARPPRLYDQSFYPPISPSSPRLHSSNTNQLETVLIRLKFWLSTPAVNLVARGREAQQSKLD